MIDLQVVGSSGLLFDSDGQYLATVDDDGFEIWETTNWQSIKVVEEDVHGVRFSPGSQYVGSFYDFNNLVKIWEVASGNEVITIPHDRNANDIDFSPNGRFLAIARGDIYGGAVQIWDIVEQNVWQELQQTGSVDVLSFSPDGRYLAFTVRDDNWKESVRVWDMSTSREVNRIGHKNYISAVMFSPDGHQLLTHSGGTAVNLWQWNPDDLIAETCDRLPRNLTQEEWQLYFGSEPYRPTCPNFQSE